MDLYLCVLDFFESVKDLFCWWETREVVHGQELVKLPVVC